MTQLQKVLKIIRIENGETQAQMAERLGIAPSTLSMREIQQRPFTEQFAQRIIEEYQLTDDRAQNLIAALGATQESASRNASKVTLEPQR